MLLGKTGVPLPDRFVCDDGLGNLIVGVPLGQFTVRLWDPTETEVSGTVPVTLSELGFGDYGTLFSPNLKGRWSLVVYHPVYFPEGKREDYDVYDQLFDDIEGESSGANVVTITVRETGAGPLVPDCTVQIFDVGLTTLYAFGSTDTAGQLIRSLDDGNYKVMLRKLASHTFDPLPKDLVVSGATAIIYEGDQFSPSTPPTPQTCVVYGWTHDAGDLPISVDIVVDLVEPRQFTTGGLQVIKQARTVSSAALDGYWELVLTRSSVYTADSVRYSFKINDIVMCEYIIPDQTSVNFADLIENVP